VEEAEAAVAADAVKPMAERSAASFQPEATPGVPSAAQVSVWIDTLRFNGDGLIPALAQDWLDGAVLMVAWMNREAIERTLASGEVHYWSRSRGELWHKGATSGQIQTLRGLRVDCDSDVLLLTVEQAGGGACHTGARSCFFRAAAETLPEPQRDGVEPERADPAGAETELPPPADACTELARVIEGRCQRPEPGSYTNKLLAGGDNAILKKIGEESAEFVMACKDDDGEAIAGEAADLVFHLQVALAHHGVSWRRVQEVLAARRGAPRRN
jgi:phosphoribosyl-ATP pyrophosphohydrolase/phosphoribosyl-AMP cyclohydrolase